MRYKLAILFSLFALSGSAQIFKTAGIPYTATTPSHTPSASGSAWAIDTANLDLYAYYGGAWNLAGERIQTIGGCAAPAYTPGKGQSVFVINGCDSLYYYRSGAWVVINAGGGGGGGGVSDGDKGDIDVSASGTVWTIDTSAVTNIKVDNNAIDSTKVGDKTLSLSDLNGSWGVQNGSVLKWNGTNWRPAADNTGTDGNGIYSGDGDIPTNTDATLPLNSYLRFEWPSGNTAFIMDDFGDTVYLADPSLASSVLISASKVGLRSTGNIELWGGTGGAKLRMLEPTGSGTNYTQIQVGAQSADITYTLPATTGTDGQYLQFTTGGQLQWSTVAAGVTDGDKGDIDVTASGATWTIDTGAVTTGKILDGTILFEDIGQNSASNGQVIKWNGTAWAAAADNTGGAGSTDLSWTGASSPYILNSSSGTDVAFAQGTGITLSTTDSTLTITNASPDQTVAITGAGISVVTGTYPNFTITSTEADGSATNEIQNLTLSGQSLGISSGTGVTLPVVGVSAGTGISVSSSIGTVTVTNAAPDQTVAITGAGISTVTGTYPNFTVTSTESDGSASNEGILGVGAGSGTTATITTNTTTGNAVTIAGGGIVAITETTSSNGGTITITATENDGSTINELQDLSLSGQSLSISNGSGVTLPVIGVSAGTGISTSISGGTVTVTNSAPDQTVGITGTGITVVSNYPNFALTAADQSDTNELQTIANTSDATSHTVTLSNSGGSVQLIEGAGISLSTGGSSSAGTVTIAATNSGTVTSVGITAPAAGITVSNSPITSSGNITLALADDLAAVEGLSTNGIAVRTATNTWATRSIAVSADAASTAALSIGFPDGVSGNPTINVRTSASSVKLNALVATTGNITLSGTQSIDGINLFANNRVLVKNQNTASENGIWVVSSGAWSRATDLDVNDELNGGVIVYIKRGTANGGKFFRLTTSSEPEMTINSTALTFSEIFDGFTLTDGDKGDIDVTSSGATWTVDTNAITTGKIANATILLEDIAANGASAGQIIKYNGSAWVIANDSIGGGGAGVTDGDKGDITVSGSGATWTIDADVVDSTNVGNKTLSVDDLNGGWGAATGTPLEWNGTNWRPGVDSSGIYSGSGNVPDNTIPNVLGYFGFQYDTGDGEAIGISNSGGTVRISSPDANTYTLVENDSLTIESDTKVKIVANTLDASGVTNFIGFPSSGGVTDGDKGDIDVTGSGATWTVDTSAISTIKVANDAITFAKMQNSAAAGLSVVGRSANSAGDFAEINAGTDGFVLRRSGTTLGFGTVATAGIADNAVNFDKFQDITGNSVLARNAAGDGSVNQVALSSSNLLGRGSTGNVSAITLGTNLSMSGSALNTTGHPTISGTPTANTIPKWTSASQLGSSLITDDGNLVAVGGTTGIVVPNGTTLQRPALPDDNGIVRYNSTIGALEYYKPGGWEAPLLSATGTGLDTAGRVLFADANGRASGSSNLFYDATNSRLGLNFPDPTFLLQVVGTQGGDAGAFSYDRYGGSPSFVVRRANGTLSSPAGLNNNDIICNFAFRGHNGDAFSSASAVLISARAAETWSTTAGGSRLTINTTANGATSSTQRFVIENNGNIGIGSSNNPKNKLQISGSLGRKTPVTVTATPYAVLDDDTWIIVNRSSSTTITLPNAADWDGREITIKTIQAQTVVSASSNIIAITDPPTASPTTSILPAADGAWALLVSDGTNWVIMQRG
jgi:hypothetical protein